MGSAAGIIDRVCRYSVRILNEAIRSFLCHVQTCFRWSDTQRIRVTATLDKSIRVWGHHLIHTPASSLQPVRRKKQHIATSIPYIYRNAYSHINHFLQEHVLSHILTPYLKQNHS